VKPADSGSLYYNYKHFFWIVLLAVSDANYNFTFVDIGAYGKNSDSWIFQNSVLQKMISRNEFNIPDHRFLIGYNGNILPHVFAGDAAFGLSTHKTIFWQKFIYKKRVYSCRHSTARRFIEWTFGVLTNKWRIFHGPLNVSIGFAQNIVKACVILHNFVRERMVFVSKIRSVTKAYKTSFS
jgi:hypothetical protein